MSIKNRTQEYMERRGLTVQVLAAAAGLSDNLVALQDFP